MRRDYLSRQFDSAFAFDDLNFEPLSAWILIISTSQTQGVVVIRLSHCAAFLQRSSILDLLIQR